jgi:arylsulfatase A-like enzyme
LLACVALAAGAPGVGLAYVPPVEVVLPPEAVRTGESARLRGPFRLVSVVDGVRNYESPIPVRPRTLFFDRPPDGMTLTRKGKRLAYGHGYPDRKRAGTWQFTMDAVTVRVAASEPAPDSADYELRWPAAAEREAGLSPVPGESGPDFVLRSMQVDDVSRRGVYLPAPARASWDVAVPEGGHFRMQIAVVPPEIDDGTRSDGADVTLAADGTPVATWRARPGNFETVDADLSIVAGRAARLTLSTADGDPTRDQVFCANPQVFVPTDEPRRVVLLFVDTLRRDHVGAYGYHRPTPAMDALAASGVVMEDARSVAPWTLPSTRSILTGMQPERWDTSTTLQARLGALGWATAAYVGNVYLSSNFDMDRDWGEHGCVNWPWADYQVWRARRFLAEHADQDALLMVHFMDPHLPYKEPLTYRKLYAPAKPKILADEVFLRTNLLKAAKGNRQIVRNYLVDRYDQNIRYVDDGVRRLMASVPADATVVLFADHGEEFFDHDELEHGHSLYDELIRVPLVVRSPGLPPGRAGAPVTSMDITPTVLELLGIPAGAFDGHSLATLARNGQDAALDGRARAFGRVLYGDQQWGSVKGASKYLTSQGRERLFDLGRDAAEVTDLVAGGQEPGPGRAALAEALGVAVRRVIRVSPGSASGREIKIHAEIPAGVERAWVSDDATGGSLATFELADRTHLSATFTSKNGSTHSELFIEGPDVPETELLRDAVVTMGTQSVRLQPPAEGSTRLARVKTKGRGVDVTWAFVPEPLGAATSGHDAEQAAALEMLGYVTRDEVDDGGASDAP